MWHRRCGEGCAARLYAVDAGRLLHVGDVLAALAHDEADQVPADRELDAHAVLQLAPLRLHLEVGGGWKEDDGEEGAHLEVDGAPSLIIFHLINCI